MLTLTLEQLLSKLEPEGECLVWTGELFRSGYGKVTYKRVTQLAHRLLYQLQKGEIPATVVLRHTCDNPRCANLQHLLPGTHQDNSDDCVSRGRQAKGEGHGRATIDRKTAQQIKDLALAESYTQAKIASLYGVKRSLVSDIKGGRCWGGV